ncbi:hypothetical protein GJAV_G00202460 [Gymnothorax javanicus]|nr:hypothetical protein GJAV_G00202460 [Gymnothorax javanicus]
MPMESDNNEVGPQVECVYCSQPFSHSTIQNHVDSCVPSSASATGDPTMRTSTIGDLTMNTSTTGDASMRPSTTGNVSGDASMRPSTTGNVSGDASMFTSEVGEGTMSTTFGQPSAVEWKTEPNVNRAALLYRRYLLLSAEHNPDVRIRLDLQDSPADKERCILAFYKQQNVKWASHLSVHLKA